MTDIDELERLARAARGWQNVTEYWPSEKEVGVFFVGATDDSALFPVAKIDGAQYGVPEEAESLAAYIAAANQGTVLELIERAKAAEADTFAAQQALITEGMERNRLAEQNAELVAALDRIIRGYVNCLEAGRDRIKSLGGQCDTVTYMENHDPWLREARATLAKVKGED